VNPAGVCLAAGASSRMGEHKALLPFGDRTALALAVQNLLAGGCAPVIVVLGADADRAAAEVPDHPDVRVVVNSRWEAGRTGGLKLGIEAAQISGATAFVVLPVDHPLVTRRDVSALVTAWRTSGATVVRCVHEGRGGHPVLFSLPVAEEVLRLGPDDPLRDVMRAHRDTERIVESSAGVRFDMNTPEDYEDALRRLLESPPEEP
jgi:molybdenum cofactor cytidylyltransferase